LDTGTIADIEAALRKEEMIFEEIAIEKENQER
jgi:hypothetical protein